MNRIVLSLVLVISGLSNQYSWCQTNVTLLSTIDFPDEQLANVWGYSSGGSEYALVGGFDGTHIIDITDPYSPNEVAFVNGPDNQWREIKTYQDYAYVVSEGGSGVQIIDLTNLPDPNPPHENYFFNVPGFGLLTKAHALHVDESAGFLYIYGSNLNSGKPFVFNLEPDPYNPTYAGRFNGIGYVHDGYADNDIMYAGHIFAGEFSIVDFSNKSSPNLLATQPTPGAFTHNTWLSGSTLFTTDEVSNSYLTAYDVSDPDNITELDRIQSNPGSGSIVHNTYIINDFAVSSWYRDGFTIVDAARPANLIQVGNYDTYDAGGSGFQGCWGVYPYFPSGTIIASNIKKFGTDDGELLIFSADYVRACYLEGTARNEDNNPLFNVQIEILNTSVSENTAVNGQYKTGLLNGGNYTVRASLFGYIPQEVDVTLSNGNLTVQDFVLELAGLPVELTQLKVREEGYTAVLNWETASETENKGFEIEHSTDITSWENIGFVAGRGSGSQYAFTTKELDKGVHYFRLKQVDFDGKFSYTDWVSLVMRGGKLRLELVPNLVNDQSTLKIYNPVAGEINLEIFPADMKSGTQQMSFSVEDNFETTLQLGHLPAGKYYVRIENGREKAVTAFMKM